MASRSARLSLVPNTLEAALLPIRPGVILTLTKPNLLLISLEKKAKLVYRRAWARLIIGRIK